MDSRANENFTARAGGLLQNAGHFLTLLLLKLRLVSKTRQLLPAAFCGTVELSVSASPLALSPAELARATSWPASRGRTDLSLRNFFQQSRFVLCRSFRPALEATMHGIIYIVGLIVVLLAVLSFFGLR